MFINFVSFSLASQVNKPELPLASGEFSMGTGITIVSTVLLMVINCH